MATKVKFFNRKTDFRGNSLWEVLKKLDNFGVGRLVVRNMFQRYPEACYMRILKVEPPPSVAEETMVSNESAETAPDTQKVRVTIEKTWRGVTLPKPITIYSTSYKQDYELVPREEEDKFLKNPKKIDQKVLSDKIEFPPLLREFIIQETGNAEPKMNVHFKKGYNRFLHLAKDGEKATIQPVMSLGKPASKKIYDGLL